MCPQSLEPIPLTVPIVERDGSITDFYRLRWQALINSFTMTPTKARISAAGLTSALGTTIALTTISGGNFEVGYYIRKTAPDGAASSLTVTIGWTQGGSPLTRVFAALTTDTNVANQSDVIPVLADANSDITIAVAYTSTTPNQMVWQYVAEVKQLA